MCLLSDGVVASDFRTNVTNVYVLLIAGLKHDTLIFCTLYRYNMKYDFAMESTRSVVAATNPYPVIGCPAMLLDNIIYTNDNGGKRECVMLYYYEQIVLFSFSVLAKTAKH